MPLVGGDDGEDMVEKLVLSHVVVKVGEEDIVQMCVLMTFIFG